MNLLAVLPTATNRSSFLLEQHSIGQETSGELNLEIEKMPRLNRRRELFCLGYFLLAAIAFRIWILVIDTYNTYLEIAASVITIVIIIGICAVLRRPADNEGEVDDPAAAREREARRAELARYLISNMQQNGNAPGLTEEMIALLPRTTFEPPVSGGDIETATEIDSSDIEMMVMPMQSGISVNPKEEGTQSCSLYSNHSCSICLDSYDRGEVLIQLPCHHDYHERCLTTWLQHRSTCPLCARSVRPLSSLWDARLTHPPSTTLTVPLSTVEETLNPSLAIEESQRNEEMSEHQS